MVWGPKISANFFCTKFVENPSGHGRPAKILDVHTKKCVFCSPNYGGETFDPRASRCKGQEYLREIRTEKFVFLLFFFFPDSCLHHNKNTCQDATEANMNVEEVVIALDHNWSKMEQDGRRHRAQTRHGPHALTSKIYLFPLLIRCSPSLPCRHVSHLEALTYANVPCLHRLKLGSPPTP